MKLQARNVHRDLAYFFVGLIIAFAFSGIFLNHRQSWYPENYTYKVEPIQASLPADPDKITDAVVDSLSKVWGMENMRGHRVRGKQLRVMYASALVEIDLETGKGEKESFFKVPLLAQFTQLHTDTSHWWIYYSDAFGIAMLTIAITGMFIQKGKYGFRRRGWWLALLGIVFPLIFLFLLA